MVNVPKVYAQISNMCMGGIRHESEIWYIRVCWLEKIQTETGSQQLSNGL